MDVKKMQANIYRHQILLVESSFLKYSDYKKKLSVVVFF